MRERALKMFLLQAHNLDCTTKNDKLSLVFVHSFAFFHFWFATEDMRSCITQQTLLGRNGGSNWLCQAPPQHVATTADCNKASNRTTHIQLISLSFI